MASVSCHRWLLSESALIKVWNLSRGRSIVVALSRDNGATLDDLREAVTTLESVANSWKQVFGQAHPETPMVQGALEMARKTLARAAASNKSKPPP